MKTTRFSDSQIIAILKQTEGGSPVPELCREHGIRSASVTFPPSTNREANRCMVTSPASGSASVTSNIREEVHDTTSM